MAYKIILNKRFLDSLSGVLDYLEKEWGKKIADEFLTKVDRRIEALESHPYIGAMTRFKNVRGIHITKHNRMYYKIASNKVTILNLYDTRRKTYS